MGAQKTVGDERKEWRGENKSDAVERVPTSGRDDFHTVRDQFGGAQEGKKAGRCQKRPCRMWQGRLLRRPKLKGNIRNADKSRTRWNACLPEKAALRPVGTIFTSSLIDNPPRRFRNDPAPFTNDNDSLMVENDCITDDNCRPTAHHRVFSALQVIFFAREAPPMRREAATIVFEVVMIARGAVIIDLEVALVRPEAASPSRDVAIVAREAR